MPAGRSTSFTCTSSEASHHRPAAATATVAAAVAAAMKTMGSPINRAFSFTVAIKRSRHRRRCRHLRHLRHRHRRRHHRCRHCCRIAIAFLRACWATPSTLRTLAVVAAVTAAMRWSGAMTTARAVRVMSFALCCWRRLPKQLLDPPQRRRRRCKSGVVLPFIFVHQLQVW